MWFKWFLNEASKIANFLFKDGICPIMGAIFGGYREMGCGFLEPVCQVRMRELFDRSSE